MREVILATASTEDRSRYLVCWLVMPTVGEAIARMRRDDSCWDKIVTVLEDKEVTHKPQTPYGALNIREVSQDQFWEMHTPHTYIVKPKEGYYEAGKP